MLIAFPLKRIPNFNKEYNFINKNLTNGISTLAAIILLSLLSIEFRDYDKEDFILVIVLLLEDKEIEIDLNIDDFLDVFYCEHFDFYKEILNISRSKNIKKFENARHKFTKSEDIVLIEAF